MVCRHFTLAALASVLGFFAGCSQQPAAPITAEEVKGTPIRGEPIQRESAAVQTNQAPVAVVTNSPGATNLAAPTQKDGDHLVVGFEYLASFNYDMPDESAGPVTDTKDQIPPSIRSLDEKPIALKGFMLPLKVESGIVTELLLMRDQSMCCYGSVPKINEWVSVKMEKGVKPVMDAPVTIYGKLQVGEVRENGYLVGLYQMDGQRMKEN